VAIIGAGPAGLATAACLRRNNIGFVLLERGSNLAMSWRGHYDQLHLHTDKARSALPYLGFAADVQKYPARDEVVAYLEQYARHFKLEAQCGTEVHELRSAVDGWELRTSRGAYLARHVVIAAGNTAEPIVPQWPGLDGFTGSVLHSSRYRSGLPFRHARVLVVGAGNSAQDIALDLLDSGAAVSWSVRRATNVIPRDPLGIPFLVIAQALCHLPARWRDALTFPLRWWLYRDLPRRGLPTLPFGPFQQLERQQQVPLIDVGVVRAIRSGALRIVPEVEQFGKRGVTLVGGQQLEVDAVILATGYRPASIYTAGSQAAVPTLHTCGYTVSSTGMLHSIAREARQIAAIIARQERRTG